MGGLITGVMVGLSSSPVAGAILPALVSGIVAGIGLFFKNPLDAQVSEILKIWSGDEVKASPPPKRRSEDAQTRKVAPDPNLPTKREAVLEELSRLNKQRRGIPRAVGLILILFFVFYGVGIFAGDKLRFENEAIKEPPVLTEALKKCKTVSEAYRSMRLYRDLQSQGISESVISEILTLPDYEPVKSEPTYPLAPKHSKPSLCFGRKGTFCMFIIQLVPLGVNWA